MLLAGRVEEKKQQTTSYERVTGKVAIIHFSILHSFDPISFYLYCCCCTHSSVNQLIYEYIKNCIYDSLDSGLSLARNFFMPTKGILIKMRHDCREWERPGHFMRSTLHYFITRIMFGLLAFEKLFEKFAT